jgi:hypothetical protein
MHLRAKVISGKNIHPTSSEKLVPRKNQLLLHHPYYGSIVFFFRVCVCEQHGIPTRQVISFGEERQICLTIVLVLGNRKKLGTNCFLCSFPKLIVGSFYCALLKML